MGTLLVRDGTDDRDGPDQPRTARIVEVEAYIGEDDLASHARFGRTARNAVMYGPPGIAYVYLVYGMHQCLNVVTEAEGRPAAVLIRAVEAVDARSSEAMRVARWVSWDARKRETDGASEMAYEWERLSDVPVARIASGPGLVAASFGLGRADTGRDLLDPMSSIRIEPGPPPAQIETSPRIGIGYAAEPWRSLPWRLFDPDSGAVSGARSRVGSRGSAS